SSAGAGDPSVERQHRARDIGPGARAEELDHPRDVLHPPEAAQRHLGDRRRMEVWVVNDELHHPALEGSRSDGVDGDVLGRQAPGQMTAEVVNGRLAGAIAVALHARRPYPVDRSEVDYAGRVV